jgi:hypothetical protein
MLDRGRLQSLGLGILAIVLVATATTSQQAAAADARRPNILFIFTDDQPQSCMGCMGNRRIKTPHMDRLAAEGVLFSFCCGNTQ